jgi:hypothetical protein
MHAGPDVIELYKAALHDKSCGVVRAKATNEDLLATVIICRTGSSLITYVPSLQPIAEEYIGGIIAPIVPSTAQTTLLLQGLVYMGLRQNKAHKSAKSVLGWVSRRTSTAVMYQYADYPRFIGHRWVIRASTRHGLRSLAKLRRDREFARSRTSFEATFYFALVKCANVSHPSGPT